MNQTPSKWTLIARFSSSCSKLWIRNGSFWYDRVTPYGDVNDPMSNSTMISTAFWEKKGHEIKITRSDDLDHTALLETTSNCLQGKVKTMKQAKLPENGCCLVGDSAKNNEKNAVYMHLVFEFIT